MSGHGDGKLGSRHVRSQLTFDFLAQYDPYIPSGGAGGAAAGATTAGGNNRTAALQAVSISSSATPPPPDLRFLRLCSKGYGLNKIHGGLW